MKEYKIIYEREGCIGAAACVNMDAKDWVLDAKDGKANLIEGVQNPQTTLWEKEIDESAICEIVAKAHPEEIREILDIMVFLSQKKLSKIQNLNFL